MRDIEWVAASFLFLLLLRDCCLHSQPITTTTEVFPKPSEIFQPLLNVVPPHCTKASIIQSMSSKVLNTKLLTSTGMNMHIGIGLKNTICFRLNSFNSPNIFDNILDTRQQTRPWLHTLTLAQLEHHHPISQQYIFAIPELHTKCVCDCDPGSDVCSARTHSFTACNSTENSVCYRTFHPSQSDTGCSPGSQSKLCCEVTFMPYKNQSYMAVKLEQPSTFAVFKYTAYDYSAGRWVEKDKSKIRLEIDGRTQSFYLDHWLKMKLGVKAGGKVSHQLETGMYFAPSNPGGEMDGLRKQLINEMNENNFERLGWYRKNAYDRFDVHNGNVKMQKLHLAKVENCKDQKTLSYLDAHHYVDANNLDNPVHFRLEKPVDQVYKWIQSARIVDGSSRQAIVTHSDGTNLEISIQLGNNTSNISFVHDFSKVVDFSGTIIVDFKSNRYFNLTVYNSTGILHGLVKRSVTKDSSTDFFFTIYVDDLHSTNQTVIVPLPTMIDGSDRLICLRADDEPVETEVCRIIIFKEQPLEINLLENTWKELGGYCPECNKLSVSGFLNNLNPANWDRSRHALRSLSKRTSEGGVGAFNDDDVVGTNSYSDSSEVSEDQRI